MYIYLIIYNFIIQLFFRFLRHGHENREKWVRFVQTNRNEDTWLPSEHTYIRSEHFKDDDKYITKAGRLYLKKCAVPYDKIASPSVRSGVSVEPISQPVSDEESIFDTPRKIVLKKKY